MLEKIPSLINTRRAR